MSTQAIDYSLLRIKATGARFAAFIDLLFSSFPLLVDSYFEKSRVSFSSKIVTINGHMMVQMENEDTHVDSMSVTVLMWAKRGCCVIMLIIILIDLWAAYMLRKATKQEEYDQKLTLHRAQIWRNVCIILLFISIVFYGAQQSFLSLVLEILFRGILLYFICSFISALQQAAPTPSNEFPLDSVV